MRQCGNRPSPCLGRQIFVEFYKECRESAVQVLPGACPRLPVTRTPHPGGCPVLWLPSRSVTSLFPFPCPCPPLPHPGRTQPSAACTAQPRRLKGQWDDGRGRALGGGGLEEKGKVGVEPRFPNDSRNLRPGSSMSHTQDTPPASLHRPITGRVIFR